MPVDDIVEGRMMIMYYEHCLVWLNIAPYALYHV